MIFIKNYGITEFYYFYQESRNYRILLFLSRITELQNSIIFIKNYRITEFIFFIKNYGITEFYCLSADPLMDFSLIP